MSVTGRRPRVLISVHNDLVRRDLLTSGVLAELRDTFDLQFLIMPGTDDSGLKELGTIAARVRGRGGRAWLWNQLAILGSIHTWTPLSGRLAREYFNRKKADNYSWQLKLLVLANRLRVAPALIWLGRRMLGVGVESALGLDGADRPDVVVAPTGLRDMVADDLVRWGVSQRIPTLFLQINSDVFNMKVPTADAAYFGVWGDQSWYMARLVCRYPATRLKMVGSPRFETYQKNPVSRADARRMLGLRDEDLVLLFGGATAAFDEPRALKQIDDAIREGTLPANLVVLYKPHPKGQVKGATSDIDIRALACVRFTPESAPGHWSAPTLYPALFSAVDAVMAPYSTMGVEGALNGLPVLCLGYHPGRFESYWRWAREFTHLQIYRDKIWCVLCHDEASFLPSVRKVLALAGDANASEAARHEVRSVAVRDDHRFSDRLRACLLEVVREGAWRPSA